MPKSFCVQNWTVANASFIVVFIAHSTKLRTLCMDCDNSRVDPELVRACLTAAAGNPSVSNIVVRTWLDNTNATRVSENLEVAGPKLSEVYFTQQGVVDRGGFEPLIITLASVKNLVKFCARELQNDIFSELMFRLGERTSPKLKRLEFSYCVRTVELPGIDSFLASDGAASLEVLELIAFCDINARTMGKLTTGLSRNNSIAELWIDTSAVDPGAANALAAYIRQNRPNLKTLQIRFRMEGDSHIQDTVLSALYSNTSVQDLTLSSCFADVTCDESVKELLLRNSHLKALTCEEWCAGDFSSAWIRSTSEGLSLNSTLTSLTMDFFGEDCDVTPILDCLVASGDKQSGLKKLCLTGDDINAESTLAISSVLRHPLCPLSELRLCGVLSDETLLSIILAAKSSPLLESLHLASLDPSFAQDTCSAIASMLPNLSLLELDIEIHDSALDRSAFDSNQKKLLKGVTLNNSLEKVSFQFGQPDDLYRPFESSLQELCIRNMAFKAATALKSHASPGTLPLAAVPCMLQTVRARCTRTGQCDEICGTILYSLLQSQLPLSDQCVRNMTEHFAATTADL